MELVEAFPLVPITNKEHNDDALKILQKLGQREESSLTEGELAYTRVLVVLIHTYEQKRFGNITEGVTGNAILQALLEENRISQTAAAELAGISKQNLNDYLKGRRGLTKTAREKLAKRFRVAASVFDSFAPLDEGQNEVAPAAKAKSTRTMKETLAKTKSTLRKKNAAVKAKTGRRSTSAKR